MSISEELLWQCRAFIHRHFAEQSRPPTADEVAAHFVVSEDTADALYLELHDRHALFLDPATGKVRMANPFSAIATDFQVRADGRSYWANCAWDALGIPTALHADAVIQARSADTNERVRLTVAYDQVSDMPALVHFAVPFGHWFDDLIFT